MERALGIRFWKNGHHPPQTPSGDSADDRREDILRLTDTWNARRLVSENDGDILWCEVFRQWYVYDGTRYVKDLTREVERRAERAVKGLYEHASTLLDSQDRKKLAEWAIQSESRNRISNMVESAKRMVLVHPNDFDIEAMLFNVMNGTIDLRTQTLRPHSREDRLTKRADVTYDSSATCPLWMSFLNRVFAGNQEVIAFVQRLFGYCLTGLLTDHIIAILYGTGANGKSTLLRVLRSLAGDYAHHCRPEVFTAKRTSLRALSLCPWRGPGW